MSTENGNWDAFQDDGTQIKMGRNEKGEIIYVTIRKNAVPTITDEEIFRLCEECWNLGAQREKIRATLQKEGVAFFEIGY